MTCVVVSCAAGEVETLLAEAAFVELAGVEEEAGCGGLCRLWLADASAAGELCARLARWSPAVEHADDTNWNRQWQGEWAAAEVGARFFLAPPDDAAATPAGRIRLVMHPGNAFGNGDHPTTHLCLMAMERHLLPGDTFLDVGCASGLLGEAAWALGAERVFGCDLDPAVVRPPGAFAGSVDAIRSETCDYVAANIQLGVLIDLLPEIARIMRPRARLVLSGILEDQLEPLRHSVTAAGLLPGASSLLGGWASLAAVRQN